MNLETIFENVLKKDPAFKDEVGATELKSFINLLIKKYSSKEFRLPNRKRVTLIELYNEHVGIKNKIIDLVIKYELAQDVIKNGELSLPKKLNRINSDSNYSYSKLQNDETFASAIKNWQSGKTQKLHDKHIYRVRRVYKTVFGEDFLHDETKFIEPIGFFLGASAKSGSCLRNAINVHRILEPEEHGGYFDLRVAIDQVDRCVYGMFGDTHKSLKYVLEEKNPNEFIVEHELKLKSRETGKLITETEVTKIWKQAVDCYGRVFEDGKEYTTKDEKAAEIFNPQTKTTVRGSEKNTQGINGKITPDSEKTISKTEGEQNQQKEIRKKSDEKIKINNESVLKVVSRVEWRLKDFKERINQVEVQLKERKDLNIEQKKDIADVLNSEISKTIWMKQSLTPDTCIAAARMLSGKEENTEEILKDIPEEQQKIIQTVMREKDKSKEFER